MIAPPLSENTTVILQAPGSKKSLSMDAFCYIVYVDLTLNIDKIKELILDFPYCDYAPSWGQ